MKLDTFHKAYNKFYSGEIEKPENVNLPIIYWGYNKKGKYIPKIINKKVPKGSLPAVILKSYDEKENQIDVSKANPFVI